MRKFIRVEVYEITETPNGNSVIPNIEKRIMLIENYAGNADNFKYEQHQKLDTLIGQALAEIK